MDFSGNQGCTKTDHACRGNFLVCSSLPSHVFGDAMDDEKRDIVLFVPGVLDFVNGYSLFGDDEVASPIGHESLAN